MKRVKPVGLDTNLFIYYFQKNPQFGVKARKIFSDLYSGKIKAVTSVITLIELLSLPANPKQIQALKESLLEIPNLTISEVDQSIGIGAANIRRKYGFKTPDAIQLATSLHARARTFITNDDRLKKFKELPVRLLSEKV